MRKDYSKRNLINAFGMNLPNNIGFIVSLFLSIIISLIICKLTGNNNGWFCLIFPFISSFVGLEIGGRLLDIHCTNKDINKCKNCKNWNCRRDI